MSLREYFVGRLIARAPGPEEKAKITFCYRFVLIYTLTTILSFPACIFFERYDILTQMILLFGMNTTALFSLRFAKSYTPAILLLAVSSLISAIGNSILASFSLSVIMFLWPIIFSVYLNYMLGNRISLAYLLIFSAAATAISVVRASGIVPYNPVDEMRVIQSTGPLILFASLFLHFFLTIYNRSRNDALTAQLRSQEERDNLLYMVAHDLRNAIGASIGSSELLKIALEEGDHSRSIDCLNLILQGNTDAMALVGDLHESTTLKSGSGTLSVNSIDIGSLIQGIVDQYQPAAANKKIALQYHVRPLEYRAEIDEDKMKRVFANLLSNAIKFSHSGGSVRISIAGNDHQIMVAIRDAGMGIPETLKKDLFVMHSPAGRKGTAGERSTGLGMYIVKSLLDQHNAAILVDSTENSGTTFTIEIPKKFLGSN